MSISPLFSFFFFLLLSIILIPSLILSLHAAFLLPIQKDHTTRQYTTTLHLKTPLQPTKLFLDLGGLCNWLDCSNNYTSTSYHHIFCDKSGVCTALGNVCFNYYCYGQPPGPGCENNTCGLALAENPLTHRIGQEPALVDSLALHTTDGSSQGPMTTYKNHVFTCVRTDMLRGFAKGVSGLASLGWSNISLQGQITTAFSTPKSFALCLSGSRSSPGLAFIGTTGPYIFLPGIDVSKNLLYTPLVSSPFTEISYKNQNSSEYFIGLNSIKVNGKVVPVNKTLLVIDDVFGTGGTKLSTAVAYTTLESSIYKAVTQVFVKESAAMNLTLTKPVKPFSYCYHAEDVLNTRVGPAVPTIDLVMQSASVYWRIFGSNSMVKVGNNWCLGFLDGGVNPKTSIVIGGFQLEDNLLQFDLKSNRLGFSSSLLLKGTNCANFNFTTQN